MACLIFLFSFTEVGKNNIFFFFSACWRDLSLTFLKLMLAPDNRKKYFLQTPSILKSDFYLRQIF